MKARTRWISLTSAFALLAGGAGGFFWWQAHVRQATVVAALPVRPDLEGRPAELRRRIEAAEARVRNNDDAPRALADLSQWYHGNGFLDEASHCYAALESLRPEESRWPYRHAMILSSYGATAEAEALFRRVIEHHPEYSPARVRLGELLLKRDARAEAEAVFNAALKLQPREPYALLGLARCDIDAGRWPAAREKLEQLTELTNFALGYDLIVSVYERLGLTERATAVRGRMKAWGAFQDPPDPWMDELFDFSFDVHQLALAAGNAKRRGDIKNARARLERALALSPEQSALHLQLGALSLDAREYTKAREHLERCTKLAPEFADGWGHLSALLTAVGDAAGAARALTEGLAHCPDSPALHLMQARDLKKAARLEEAVAEFRISIRLRPTEADPYIDLAITLSALGRKSEALTELARALVAEPEHPVALTLLVLHAIDRGDEPAARHFFELAKHQPRVALDDLERIRAAYQGKFGRAAP